MMIKYRGKYDIQNALDAPGKGKSFPEITDKKGRIKKAAFLVSELIFIFLISTSSFAQPGLGVDPTGRSGDEPPPLPIEKPKPSPKMVLPPPPLPPEREIGRLPLVGVFIKEIKVTGATVFSEEELQEVVSPYTNRELTGEDLEEIRRDLTKYYVSRGYINSGAIIPDQAVVDGLITLHIIEGELTRMEVEGLKWFRAGYIKKRIALGADSPLNVVSLQRKLQLLQQDPRIQRVNAELKPGVRPGESVLNLRVQEEFSCHGRLRFNNYQSPSVGAERGEIAVTHLNLTGNGDILDLIYGRSDGIDPRIDIRYLFPLTARDTTLTLEYRRNDFSVVEAPFSSLDVKSESEILGVTLRHPIYRNLNQEFALALMGERLHDETFLLGERFSFSPGTSNGKSTATALRFLQEWTYRTPAQVFAVRSRFSWGIDALGATTNASALPDSRFFSWLGQFQWARRLEFRDMQVIFRADVQVTDDPLLSLEQIAIGGRYSVRGYRENQMVRDNGIISSLEFRVPLFQENSWSDSLQLATFVDFGRGWNKDMPTPNPQNITSMGLGLIWGFRLPPPLHLKPRVEMYWGFPFRDIEAEDWDLQDEGIHIQLTIDTRQ